MMVGMGEQAAGDCRDDPMDLLLTGGRVIDPAESLDEPLDIGVKDGRIAMLASPGIQTCAIETLNVEGKLVVPGLIDLHCHVFWGGMELGIRAAPLLETGATTVVDAGSAGAANFRSFHELIVQREAIQVLAFLNIYIMGLVTNSSWVMPRHDLAPIHFASVGATIAAAEEFADVVVGVKVLACSGYNPHGRTAVQLAIRAAELIGKPLMAHFGYPPITLKELLSLLRPRDILTHAFQGGANSGLTANGDILPELRDARDRGVLIDIGHGMGSFSVEVARRMLEAGFRPDIISSDLHNLCMVQGPVYDLPTTMSKFLCLGMDIGDVIRATTCAPAQAIGRLGEIGHLRAGSVADIAVLELRDGDFQFEDASLPDALGIRGRKIFRGTRRLVPNATILGGRIVWRADGSAGSS